jgi:hypothetical protein
MASFLEIPGVETEDSVSPNESQSDIGSARSNQPRKRKLKAVETWKHTREPRGEEAVFIGKDRLLYCKYCNHAPYQSTSSFRNHLSTQHDIHVDGEVNHLKKSTQEQLQALYDKANESGSDLQPLEAQILKRVLKKSVITSGLIAMIAVENLSFRLVESAHFQAFCRTLNPEVGAELYSAHAQVSDGIGKSYLHLKDIVQRKLQSSLSKIHISLDIWTSPNRLLFLAVCAHFVEPESKKLAKALLQLRSVPSHSAKDQLDALREILEGYQIAQNLGVIIGDNVSANDKLARLISKFLLDEKKIRWNPVHNCIRCSGHIINLAVQAFLTEAPVVDGLDDLEELEELESDLESLESLDESPQRPQKLQCLAKLHKIVVHIRSSPGRSQNFKELADRLIPLDNATRWNSWYQMLTVALDKKAEIDTYTKNWYSDLEASYLNPLEWERLAVVMTFLRPFYRATLETEGDHATIDRILFTMDILVKHFEAAKVGFMIISIWKLLSRRKGKANIY